MLIGDLVDCRLDVALAFVGALVFHSKNCKRGVTMTLVHEIAPPDHLPLFEIRPGAEAELRSVMDGALGFETHYLGRSVLCGGPGCDGCRHRGRRWLGYLGVYHDGRPKMLELTAAAWQSAWQRVKFEGLDNAAGVIFRVRKRALRSPLQLEPVASGGSEENERATVRVLRTVARLYRLPLPMDGESAERWNERVTDARLGIVRAALASELGSGALRSGV